MQATLTLNFGKILTESEQIELLDEVRRRGCAVEEVLVEALRLRRAAMQSPTPPTLAGAPVPPALAA